MIIGFFGNVRQGKTLGAVAELHKFWLHGYTIYSNTHLSFNYKPLTLDFLYDIVEQELDIEDHCVFFIDEIHIWLDSRVSGSKRNRVISYFLLQTGKMGVNTDFGLILMFTSQFPHQIDKRLRFLIDIAVESQKVIKGNRKIFIQTRYIYKGKQSFMYKNILRNPEHFYLMYDTRQKIKAELHDRYDEE